MDGRMKHIVVVMGMHRSGTSAVTRGLTVLGVDLGDELHPAGNDNPKGFWEDEKCLRINETLLQHLRLSYDALGLSSNFLETLNDDEKEKISSLKLEAIQVIRDKFIQANLCGIKDPRISRLLPFWKEVFKEIDCAVSYLIVLRNPISVARSLEYRNGIEPEKSYFLWLEHVVAAILESSGSSRIVVDYDLFMDAPARELQRIAQTLRLGMPNSNTGALQEFTDGFLASELRHTRYELKDMKLDPKLPEDAYRVYSLIQQHVLNKVDLDSNHVQQTLEEVRDRLQICAPAFRYMNTLERRFADLKAERDRVLNSRSWKITKPLRFLLRITNELLRRQQ
jgi:hypothetical protein